MLKIELLKKEDLKNKIFRIKGIGAQITDFGYMMTMNKKYPNINYPYWLNSFIYKPRNIGNFKKSIVNEVYGEVAKSNDYITYNTKIEESTKSDIGIRIKIPYSQLKSEIVDEYIDEDGIKVVLAGEYPQDLAPNQVSHDLTLLYINNILKPNKKTYTIYSNYYKKDLVFDEYTFNNKRYILFDSQWIEVKPIEWYIDENLGIAFSKKIILAGIPLSNDFLLKSSIRLKESLVSMFIKTYLQTDIIMSEHHKNLYNFPIALEGIYYKELKEIKFWETVEADRKQTIQDLRILQELLKNNLSIDEINKVIDMYGLIDRCITVSSRDQQLIKQKKYKDFNFET